MYNTPCNIINRDARTFNRLASCRSSGSIPPYRFENIGVIQEVSMLMGFTSAVCKLDCVTISILSSSTADKADLANWSAAVFSSRGMRLSFTSRN